MNIFIMGRAGVGKDTVADYLVQEYDFKKYRLAQMVEDLCRDYFGMIGKDRRLMIDVSEKMKEGFGQDFWIKAISRQAESELTENPYYSGTVISDVRFPAEYSYFYQRGFHPVRVVAPKELCIERLKQRDGNAQIGTLGDPTETKLIGWVAYEIVNDGSLPQLYKQVDRLIDKLIASGKFEDNCEWWDMEV